MSSDLLAFVEKKTWASQVFLTL